MHSIQNLVARMTVNLLLPSLYILYYIPGTFSLPCQLFTDVSLKIKMRISTEREIMSPHG